MDTKGRGQASALPVESIQGPGPGPGLGLTVQNHRRIKSARNHRIAKLESKGVDIHLEVLWIVAETETSTATGAVGGRGALATAGIEVKSSEIESP